MSWYPTLWGKWGTWYPTFSGFFLVPHFLVPYFCFGTPLFRIPFSWSPTFAVLIWKWGTKKLIVCFRSRTHLRANFDLEIHHSITSGKKFAYGAQCWLVMLYNCDNLLINASSQRIFSIKIQLTAQNNGACYAAATYNLEHEKSLIRHRKFENQFGTPLFRGTFLVPHFLVPRFSEDQWHPW